MENNTLTKQNVLDILTHPLDYEWSVQGFGFLRCYLKQDGINSTRLHIWDNRLAQPGGSRIHTHPWQFTSHIISGVLLNIRYALLAECSESQWNFTHYRQKLKAGEGAHLLDKPIKVRLLSMPTEIHTAGYFYKQESNEIHESLIGINGTVSIIERIVDTANKDHAFTFWDKNSRWNTHAPKTIKVQDYVHIFDNAVKLLEVNQ